MEHAATLDLENFEDPEFYDSMERARRQTVGRIGLLAVLLGIGQSGLTLISLLVALIAFNGWLLLMLVFAVLPSFIGETHFAGLSYSLLYKWTPERRELDYLRYVATSNVTAKEVKLFGLADYFTASISDSRTSSTRLIARSPSNVPQPPAAHGRIHSGILRGERLHHHRHGAWDPLARRSHLPGGVVPAEPQPDQWHLLRSADVYQQSLFLRDLFTFLEMTPRTASPAHPVPFPRPISDGVVFENVGFRYPDSETWALRGVSLRIGAGERVALVGENGAGKPRWSSFWPACTTRRRGGSCWTGSTFASTTSMRSAERSGSFSRISCDTIYRCVRTSRGPDRCDRRPTSHHQGR